MKRYIYLLLSTIILASCSSKKTEVNKDEELTKLKKERASLDEKINKLEAETNKGKTTGKITPVSVMEVQPANFNAFVEIQAQVAGDQNVNATPQAPGTVSSVLVRPGQHVGKGQTLATLDASALEQQIKAMDAQLTLQKSLYERQQKLWAQNIGTEVQLLSAKTQYDATQKQKAALEAQRRMYSIVSPISGTVDQVNIKVGDASAPGLPTSGIHVVSFDQLKATANLGENYLGKVHSGDKVTLIFPDIADTMHSKLSYVSQAVDPISRSFQVEIRLGNNSKLHPNMSCKMQIANYQNSSAIVVPVSVIQKTAEGEMLYIADGNIAKSVMVTTGHNANGMVEVTSGLNAGDKIVTAGYEELDNGQQITIK